MKTTLKNALVSRILFLIVGAAGTFIATEWPAVHDQMCAVVNGGE